MRKAIVLGFLAVAACGDGGGAQSPDASVDGPVDAPPAALPDLRFKWVGAFPSYQVEGTLGIGGDLLFESTAAAYASVTLDGSTVTSFGIPVDVQPFVSTALHLPTADLDERLQAMLPNAVVTSLAISADFGSTLTATASATPNTALASLVATVPQDQLASYAATKGGQGFVITALAQNGAHVQVISYASSLAADHPTFETMVLDADAATLGAQAAALAAGGYIVTAAGTIGPGAFALVGTRPTGTSAPHGAMTVGRDALGDALARGYAIVAAIADGAGQRYIVEN